MEPRRIGIIAGGDKCPFVIAHEALEKGYDVSVCAIKDECDLSIENVTPRVRWIKLGELGRLIHFFQSEKVQDIIFSGKITKPSLFSGRFKPDIEMVKFMLHLKDRKDTTLLQSLARYLESKGMHVIDPTPFLGESLPGPDVLTKRKPTNREKEDIKFGWPIARELARMDIGQTLIVKEKSVLAVESIEGTNETIKRGGHLGSRDVVVVKVARPEQDMRFDVPTVGLDTIRIMDEVGASALAFEAGKTIFIDKADLVKEADRRGITIVGK